MTCPPRKPTSNTASADRVAVIPGQDDPEVRLRAKRLATSLRLPFVDSAAATGCVPELLLVVRADRLELGEAPPAGTRPIYVDFVGGPTGFRRGASGGRDQPIARAVGLRRGRPTVVDATAGLGRDAFLLASLGCRVTALERSPILAALLRDGCRRAAASGDSSLDEVLARLTIVEVDARDALAGAGDGEAPEVVYLDPMYPPAKKGALVKKELRILRRLVGDDPDAATLLETARRVATRRVVVKRARYAPPLAPDPVASHVGSRVRYDVYSTGL